MITVKVKAILDMVRLVGGREQTLSFPAQVTVADVLNRLIDLYGPPLADRLYAKAADNVCGPHAETLKKGIIILVNGQNIYFLNQLATRLADGDEVLLFPPAGGG